MLKEPSWIEIHTEPEILQNLFILATSWLLFIV